MEDEIFGPQRAGGQYWSGYWQHQYTVLAVGTHEMIEVSPTGVHWHWTSWDRRNDRVIWEPPTV